MKLLQVLRCHQRPQLRQRVLGVRLLRSACPAAHARLGICLLFVDYFRQLCLDSCLSSGKRPCHLVPLDPSCHPCPRQPVNWKLYQEEGLLLEPNKYFIDA